MRVITTVPRLLLCIALWAGVAQASDAPRRVVSFNLCADQLVVALADPEQIAGLSPYATDSALSVVADKARAFRKADWQAESTLLLEPDLVLIGPNDRSVTRRMLASQGLRVVETGFVSDLELGPKTDPGDRGVARPHGTRRTADRGTGARAFAPRCGRDERRSHRFGGRARRLYAGASKFLQRRCSPKRA